MKFSVQRMTRIAILTALAIGLRSAFIGLPNIQPITAMFFVAVLYLGLVDGLLIMALTMAISGFLYGFGPWVFNQILTFGVLMELDCTSSIIGLADCFGNHFVLSLWCSNGLWVWSSVQKWLDLRYLGPTL